MFTNLHTRMYSSIMYILFIHSMNTKPYHLYQRTRQSNIPPIFLSTHSLASNIPLSVQTNIHSPTLVNPGTIPTLPPNTIFRSPSTSIHILLVGLLIRLIFSNTGSLFQYFMPSHSLLDAMFWRVMGSMSVFTGCERRACGSGGLGPPRTTVDTNPEDCRASASRRC